MDEGPEEQETFASLQTDVQLLQQAWVNETAAPELLHYDAELVAALQDELMRQGDRAASVGDAAESTARVLPGQTRRCVLLLLLPCLPLACTACAVAAKR